MNKRRVLVKLHESFFDDMIKSGKFEVDLNGFPEDAKFIGVRWSAEYDGIILCYEHESFDEVELGSIIPSDNRITFRRNYDA